MIWIEMKSGMSQEPLESLLLMSKRSDRFPRAALNTCSGERGLRFGS